MDKKSFKNFVSSQQELRELVYKIMKRDPKSLVKVAKEMDIGAMTLINFLKHEKDVDYVRLLKIEKWVQEREKMNT